MATTVRPARPRQHSPAPYQAEECAVSTLSGAGAAPSLSQDPDTAQDAPLPAPGNRGEATPLHPIRGPPHLDSLGTGERGRPKQQLLHSPPPAVKLPRPATGDHGLRECRLGHLTRIETGVGRGGGNPRVSQPVPEKGARSQRCVARNNVDSTPRVPSSFTPTSHPRARIGREAAWTMQYCSSPSQTKQLSRNGERRRGATQGN